MFNNFTLVFSKNSLIVLNNDCDSVKLVYDWKNYSYNIDLVLLNESVTSRVSSTP